MIQLIYVLRNQGTSVFYSEQMYLPKHIHDWGTQ